MKPFVRGRFIPIKYPADATFEIILPPKITVLAYRSQVDSSQWKTSVQLEAIDVTDGRVGHFGSETIHTKPWTMFHVHEQAMDMLSHEVRHQLKMPTHPDGPDPGFVRGVEACKEIVGEMLRVGGEKEYPTVTLSEVSRRIWALTPVAKVVER